VVAVTPSGTEGSTVSGARWATRVLSALALVAIAVATTPRQAYSHPLHTTLTEITVARDGRMQIVVRAFVDDFAAAIARRPSMPIAETPTPSDTAAARYLATTLTLVDATGRRVPLRVTSVRRTNELVWVTLQTPPGNAERALRLTNRMLFERFDDQVNIVQATLAGRRQTLLFTSREGAASRLLAP
jgi:hypothetical protein